MPCNPEQQRIINDFLSNPASITLIQGKAGSGKSYLVRELVSRAKDTVILTPTNMAKSVYKSAQTIHSFFYGEFDDLDEGYQNPKAYSESRNRFHHYFAEKLYSTQTIVIDEISMVRADTFEMMNTICQETMCNNRPFGGLKVILVGDLYQLPPIVDDEEIGKYLKDEYGGYFFFNSHVIQDHLNEIRFYELQHSVRHGNDREYECILDGLRRGCPVAQAVEMLAKVNRRVVPESMIPSNIVTIASSNAEVLRINHRELAKLSGMEHRELAVFTVKNKACNSYTTYTVDEDPLDESVYHQIEVPSKFEPDFHFKEGARVMFTESRRKEGYSNGDFGTIVRIARDHILVKSDKTGQEVMIVKSYHYRYQMEYDWHKKSLVRITPYIQRTDQYPLKLGYAFTIHKSQGQTYNQIVLDLHSHIFAPGQLYVALSRVRSLNGLFLTKPVSISDIIVDQEVNDFLGRFSGNHHSNGAACKLPVSNTSLERFRSFVSANEQSSPVRYYIEKSMKLANELFTLGYYPYALLEIIKSLVILEDYYHTENYRALTRSIRDAEDQFPHITANQCEEAASKLLDLYRLVFQTPHKTVVNDKR